MTITTSVMPSGMVDVTSAQTIAGAKSFTSLGKFKTLSTLDSPLSNINYAGAVSSAANSWLWASIFAFGSATPNGPVISPFQLSLNDQIVGYPNEVDMFALVHRVGGGSTTGTHTTLRSDLGVTGYVGPDASYRAFVSQEGLAYATATMGGDGTTDLANNPFVTAYQGALFGGNDNVSIRAGATYWGAVIGREIDVAVAITTGRVYQKLGLLIAQGPSDVSRAVGDDAAIVIANSTGLATWKMGLMFGQESAVWPFASDSTLISFKQRVFPVASGPFATPVAGKGVDFAGITFTISAFASTGFSVDPTGIATVKALVAQPGASQTPAANGDVTFQLTSNTTLTFKAKGSDGTIRSAAVTLS